MSDNEDPADGKIFCIEKARQGRASCKKCKQKCLIGSLRIGKLIPNPFSTGKMKTWYHVDCMFEQFLKQRQSTKRIESPDDIEGWDELSADDQTDILNGIEESEMSIAEKYGTKYTPKKLKSPKQKTPPKKRSPNTSASTPPTQDEKVSPCKKSLVTNKDALFREFRRLVANISNVNSYTEKTNLVSNVFTKGSDGKGFKGDVTLWCRLLLPGVVKRVYNLQSKQLTKLFSKIFKIDHTLIAQHLEQGDIGEIIQHFFEQSNSFKPKKKSLLTMEEVDNFLDELSLLTKEEEQLKHFKAFFVKCTSNDLKIIVRLIKHDLRMNAGAKHILDGVHPDAYQAYQASRDITTVITRCLGGTSKTVSEVPTSVKATISLLTPVLPMLAEACKSVEQAVKKCPNGIFAEIKYDGERVQVHKHGGNFKYFSRSLKPVMQHKVAHFKEYIRKAFPHGKDLILDSEILMINTVTGKPLPFGSLGIHKKTEFKDANVCLFVFDCIYFNGQVLMDKPLKYRKQILRENMTEIPNRIVFSEMEMINATEDLNAMIAKVFKLGLEGLVLKDILSIYEPGKRHWLKVKKDYLFDGAMADSADLIVLGAWYGTGKKAGMMSVFLMGCYDAKNKIFCTVTKVHTGHDDKTLERLQTELQMIKISGDVTKVPSWLKCTKTMIPDFVAQDPEQQPVWEITGAEFTQHEVHTANGISIRFPRVTKIRDDKTWETATTLKELNTLYKTSKINTDVSLLVNNVSNQNDNVTDTTEPKDNKLKRKKNATKKVPQKKLKPAPAPETQDTSSVSEDTVTNECTAIKQPLPDLFASVKLLLEDGARERYAESIRYFIGYGGVIVEDWKYATHVLHIGDTVSAPTIACPNNARHIIVEWINDTVANGKLEDFRPYTVRWQPSENAA